MLTPDLRFHRVLAGAQESLDARVADHTVGPVAGRRVHPPRVHPCLGNGDEEGASLMHRVRAPEVHIAPVHHVEGPGFHGEDIEHVPIVQLGVADVDEGRDRPAQVEQGVQLDGGLGSAKRRPVVSGYVEARLFAAMPATGECAPGTAVALRTAVRCPGGWAGARDRCGFCDRRVGRAGGSSGIAATVGRATSR